MVNKGDITSFCGHKDNICYYTDHSPFLAGNPYPPKNITSEYFLTFHICHLSKLHLGQNKKIPVFRVTRPYLNLLVKPRIFLFFFWKIYNFMHFERLSKCIKLYFFPKKKRKKVCVTTLPKIFRPVTRITHIFIFGSICLLSKMYYAFCSKGRHENTLTKCRLMLRFIRVFTVCQGNCLLVFSIKRIKYCLNKTEPGKNGNRNCLSQLRGIPRNQTLDGHQGSTLIM